MSRTEFIRAELHNHSTESDGKLSIRELVEYAQKQHFEVLAVTDHNTVSGQAKAFQIARDKEVDILPGVEITTFYGHILALGLRQMIDFSDFDPRYPEELVRKLKAKGARAVGCAHPFCIGEPIMKGCRLAMEFRYPEVLDYIEVFNTSASDVFAGNAFALNWWEKLVLQGIRISAVSGIDLHTIPENAGAFTTYAIVRNGEKNDGKSKAELVLEHICRQKTMVSKGPLFHSEYQNGEVQITLREPGKEGMLLQLKDNTGEEKTVPADGRTRISIGTDPAMKSAVVKLYEKTTDFAHLLAVGEPIYRDGSSDGAGEVREISI